MYTSVLLCVLLVPLLLLNVLAQEPETADTLSRGMLKVYIDCNFCDMNYLRENIRFIHYVRERKEAQVHVLVTNQSTGSGGEEFTLFFIGQQEFQGKNDTLAFTTPPDATDDDKRLKGARTLKLGLLYYVARTPAGEAISIEYDQLGTAATGEDPWKNWVFSLGMNGWFNGQESTKTANIQSSFDVSKVLPEWKIKLGAGSNYREERFVIVENELLSIWRSHYGFVQYVKSLTSHWSAGGGGLVNSSLFSNIKLSYRFGPAVEYNLFPYEQSTRRQLTFLYSFKYGYNYYNDTTVYDKTEEVLPEQEIVISLQVNEKWGRVNLTLSGSNLFPDYRKNRLDIYTSLDFRILKGLSFNVSGGLSFVQDQIALPKEGASEQEILLRLREIASQYNYWGNAGFTYTFGSIYNNVVNPRFGN